MTVDDVRRIFGCYDEIIISPTTAVTVEDFLHLAGFEACEPTKEAMLAFDGGTKGYSKFIETGSFEI